MGSAGKGELTLAGNKQLLFLLRMVGDEGVGVHSCNAYACGGMAQPAAAVSEAVSGCVYIYIFERLSAF